MTRTELVQRCLNFIPFFSAVQQHISSIMCQNEHKKWFCIERKKFENQLQVLKWNAQKSSKHRKPCLCCDLFGVFESNNANRTSAHRSMKKIEHPHTTIPIANKTKENSMNRLFCRNSALYVLRTLLSLVPTFCQSN